MVDANVDDRAEPARRAGQVDELVLAGPAREVHGLVAADVRRDRDGLVGVLMVVRARGNDRVHQDLHLAPEPGLIALETDRLLERQQLVEPAPLVDGGHVVGKVRRRCTRSF